MDCECDFQLSREDMPDGLVSYVQRRASAKHIPLNAAIELTLGCNIRCQHCYNFDRDEAVPKSLQQALSPAEIIDAIQQLRAAGCLYLYFTGGESTMHPHFFEFVEESRRQNMSLYILSNGTLIDEAFVAKAKTFPNISAFSLSLYGATAATHDAITQVPGSFDRTWNAANLLRGAGYHTLLKYIVMKRNQEEVAAALPVLQAEGFSVTVDVTITGRHDGETNSLATRIDHDGVQELFSGPLRQFLPAKPLTEFFDDSFMCNCAQGNCAITATGDVQPCISVPMSGGNIREHSFQHIWDNSELFQRLRGLTLQDFSTCSSCEIRNYCSRSPGGTYMATGEYTSVDPWICKTTEIKKSIVEAT